MNMRRGPWSQTPTCRVLTLAVLMLFLTSAQVFGQQAPAIPDDIEAMLTRAREQMQAFRFEAATAEYGRALAAARERGLPAPESDALRGLALVESSRLNHRGALGLNEQALAIAEKLGDRGRIATALNNMGINYSNLSNPEKAIEFGQRALAIRTEMADKAGMASAMTNVASAMHRVRRYDEALDLLTRAAPMHREAGNRRFEANALSIMATIYQSKGESEKSLALMLQVLELRREIKDGPGEAIQLFNLGTTFHREGQLDRAREYLEAGVALNRKLGDTLTEARTIGALGSLYEDMGLSDLARDSLQQSLALLKRTGNPATITQALILLGEYFKNQAEFQKAMDIFVEALDIAKQQRDVGLESAVNEKLCSVYLVIGQPVTGLEYARRALDLAVQAQDVQRQAGALTALGVAYSDLRRYDRALEVYTRVRSIAQRYGDYAMEAASITNSGNANLKLGNHREALALFNEALPLHRARGLRVYEANTLLSLGSTYYLMDAYPAARESYQAALAIYRDLGYRDQVTTTLASVARILIAEKRYDEAEPLLSEAAALFERLRSGLGAMSGAKSAYLAQNKSIYNDYSRLALLRGRNRQAFELAQKNKSRALIDFMETGRIDLSASLTADEREKERSLRARIDKINSDMIREGVRNQVGSKARYAALEETLLKAEFELETFTNSLYVRYPELANRRAARTATLPEVARALPADTALVEYAFVAYNELAIFVVRGGVKESHALKVVRMKTRHNDLVEPVLDFRARCADPRKSVDGRAKELYNILVKPVESHLLGVRRLVICPYTVMWEAPFQVMLSPKGRLGDRFEIAYAHSATAAVMGRRIPGVTPPKGSVLVVANPDFGASSRFGELHDLPGQRPIDRPARPLASPSRPLISPSRPLAAPSRAIESLSRAGKIIPLPGTKREAEAIRRAYPGACVLVETRAQEGLAATKMGQHRFVHFATHGFFNDFFPMTSSIILAQPARGSKTDGFLTAREIFEMKLNCEMIVLSACNTARGTQGMGDGIVGLTWALFVAGCPTQVVSQWAVDDASTALLMGRFYENLAKRKMTKSGALKEASLWLRGRGKKYQHPYYWAPFVLNGAWR